MTNIPPEGFGLKDKVTFDQLPEQLQAFHVGPGFGEDPSKESLWLKETRAVLTFFPPTGEPWTKYWEKTPDGWWVEVDK